MDPDDSDVTGVVNQLSSNTPGVYMCVCLSVCSLLVCHSVCTVVIKYLVSSSVVGLNVCYQNMIVVCMYLTFLFRHYCSCS